VHAKVTYITCCYDGIVVACRSLFVMGSDVGKYIRINYCFCLFKIIF